MKNSALASFVAVALSIPVSAQSNYVGPPVGNWSRDGNWSPMGVPGAGAVVNFINNDDVDRTLFYDYVGPVIQLGTFSIVQKGPGSHVNTFSMGSGVLYTASENLGQNGRAVFNQTGGTHSVTGSIIIGDGFYYGLPPGPKPDGSYTMSGGSILNVGDTLMIANSSQDFFNEGKGVFNQNGGRANVHSLRLGCCGGGLAPLGDATYNLNGGSLTVIDAEQIDAMTALFHQTNGDHTAGALLVGTEGNGTFTLEGGTLTVTGESTAYAGFGEHVGHFSEGVFNQTGGVHVLKKQVLLLAYGAASKGTYNLSGGSLTTPVTQLADGGTAVFNQTGGTHTTGSLVMGTYKTAHPSYLLSDGMLIAGKTTNNGAITQSAGTATIGPVDGTGSITISGISR